MKFKINDRVKISSVRAGCVEGIVMDVDLKDIALPYLVAHGNENSRYDWFSERQLTSIDQPDSEVESTPELKSQEIRLSKSLFLDLSDDTKVRMLHDIVGGKYTLTVWEG